MKIINLVIILLSSWPCIAWPVTLNVGLQLEPPNLDPTSGAAAAIDDVVYGNIFEGLVRINEDGDVQPGLSLSWDIGDDGKSYIFYLAKGVLFHNGDPFTATDVKFSFSRARSDSSTNAKKYIFKPIVDINVIDPHTVMITLDQARPDFLFNIGLGDAVIVNKDSADRNSFNPVGTGPFKFIKWVRGDRVELERYKKYWGPSVFLEGAHFKFITDPLSAYTAMKAGDIDAFPNYPVPENLFLFENDPAYEVVIGLTAGETILATNNRNPPFDNVLVRKAIAYAIDRSELIDGAMFGNAVPIGSHFAPNHPDYIDLTGLFPHNLDQARQLLLSAGYPNGFSASLKLPPPIYARRTGELIASQLGRVGINIKIENMEWSQWIDQVLINKNYDLSIVSHVEPMDINIYANHNYYFGYDNDEFKQIILDIETSTDALNSSRLYKLAQKKIAEDAVNGYLFQLGKYGVWKTGLKGMWSNYPIRSNDLRGVYLEGEKQ